MNRRGFIEELEKRFMEQFKASKKGNVPSLQDRYKLEGFVEAGIYLSLVRHAEVEELIERVHLLVFRMTRAEHKEKHAASWSQSNIDYSSYDAPTFERLSNQKTD